MSQPLSLVEFAADLVGKRVAVVYSDRFVGNITETWYHRWQTNVISFFSNATEKLKANVSFFNIDQFISHCADRQNDGEIDFVVNLNAGNLFLDNWAIVPSLCRWRQLPVFPCSAMTVLLGEEKIISRELAKQSGWKVPRQLHETPEDVDDFVLKPLTFGSSVGIERLNRIDASARLKESYFVEEFVPGFDATLVLLYSSVADELVCMGAQATIPTIDRPQNWMFDAFEKRNPGVRAPVEELLCPVSEDLAAHAVALSRLYGSRAVTRIDVRVSKRPRVDEPIRFEDCSFLEINPMPTIGPTNSVTKFAEKFVREHRNHESLGWANGIRASVLDLAGCYILLCGLYAINSR